MVPSSVELCTNETYNNLKITTLSKLKNEESMRWISCTDTAIILSPHDWEIGFPTPNQNSKHDKDTTTTTNNKAVYM